MLVTLLIWFIIITYIMSCSNPHDYQNKQYHKLYTLSFIPQTYRVKSDFYSDKITSNYSYPYILKPFVCDSFSIGVKKIHNQREHLKYFNTYHPDRTYIEEYTPYVNEIGISYIKTKNKFHYLSCIQRINHKNDIIDFGKEYVEKIWAGIPCGIDRNDLLTSRFISILDHIGDSIPGNCVGRYDIKYKDDISLQQGKHFVILEVNGGIGLDLRITTVNVYDIIGRLTCLIEWIGIRVLRGCQNLSLINHEQAFTMHITYGLWIVYYIILTYFVA